MEYAQHDGDFAKDLSEADLAHLVTGQTLYLSDPRNTPVEVLSRDPSTASFSARVSDFEDMGAKWILPLWDVSKFLVTPGAQMLTDGERATLKGRCVALDRTMQINAGADDYDRTQAKVVELQREICGWLEDNFPKLPANPAAMTTGKQPCSQWSLALEKIMISKGLLEIDQAFAAQYASNPKAGEMIKGHQIVLAELGLTSYQGHVVRDPRTFDGEFAKPQRRAHILIRLAFMQAMLCALQMTSVPLFRTIYSNDKLDEPKNTGFVSTTFSADVASALFRTGQKTHFAATYWQRVPPDRMFMSYFETPELSRRFQEAEAVLLFDSSNRVF
jgi:hypothetical protein